MRQLPIHVMSPAERLRLEVEREGGTPGTPAFEARLRAAKVAQCQESRGEVVCAMCGVFDYCELAKAHLRDVRFGVPEEPGC